MDKTLLILCPEIERAHHRCAYGRNVEQQKDHVQQLVDYTDRCHSIVGMMAQHQRVHHAQRQHQQRLQEDRASQLKQLASQSLGTTKEIYHAPHKFVPHFSFCAAKVQTF